MAIVVVGGHSRDVGKTSVVAGLIAALPEYRWTAVKITQFGHGICSADGAPCECATDSHTWSVSEERDRSGESDSSRFLVSGAARSLWVRTRIGRLAEAMPRLRREIQPAENVIIESNSVMRFLRPKLYIAVLDPAQRDFKESALRYLDLASAVVTRRGTPQWENVAQSLITGKPVFTIEPPEYCPPELVSFVREHMLTA